MENNDIEIQFSFTGECERKSFLFVRHFEGKNKARRVSPNEKSKQKFPVEQFICPNTRVCCMTKAKKSFPRTYFPASAQ